VCFGLNLKISRGVTLSSSLPEPKSMDISNQPLEFTGVREDVPGGNAKSVHLLGL